jgi:hypothetical protein
MRVGAGCGYFVKDRIRENGKHLICYESILTGCVKAPIVGCLSRRLCYLVSLVALKVLRKRWRESCLFALKAL